MDFSTPLWTFDSNLKTFLNVKASSWTHALLFNVTSEQTLCLIIQKEASLLQNWVAINWQDADKIFWTKKIQNFLILIYAPIIYTSLWSLFGMQCVIKKNMSNASITHKNTYVKVKFIQKVHTKKKRGLLKISSVKNLERFHSPFCAGLSWLWSSLSDFSSSGKSNDKQWRARALVFIYYSLKCKCHYRKINPYFQVSAVAPEWWWEEHGTASSSTPTEQKTGVKKRKKLLSKQKRESINFLYLCIHILLNVRQMLEFFV